MLSKKRNTTLKNVECAISKTNARFTRTSAPVPSFSLSMHGFWTDASAFEPMLFCTNHRFGPIGQRSISLVLKHVLKFWPIHTGRFGPMKLNFGSFSSVRPCVQGLIDCHRAQGNPGNFCEKENTEQMLIQHKYAHGAKGPVHTVGLVRWE